MSPSDVAGQWDAYMLDINSSGPILHGDELWIYYGGRARHHAPAGTLYPEDQALAAIGLATLRRDGMFERASANRATTNVTENPT